MYHISIVNNSRPLRQVLNLLITSAVRKLEDNVLYVETRACLGSDLWLSFSFGLGFRFQISKFLGLTLVLAPNSFPMYYAKDKTKDKKEKKKKLGCIKINCLTSPLGVNTKTRLLNRSLVMVSTNSLELMLPTNSSCHSLIALSQPIWRKQRTLQLKFALKLGTWSRFIMEAVQEVIANLSLSKETYPESNVCIVETDSLSSWTSTIRHCISDKTS